MSARFVVFSFAAQDKSSRALASLLTQAMARTLAALKTQPDSPIPRAVKAAIMKKYVTHSAFSQRATVRKEDVPHVLQTNEGWQHQTGAPSFCELFGQDPNVQGMARECRCQGTDHSKHVSCQDVAAHDPS